MTDVSQSSFWVLSEAVRHLREQYSTVASAVQAESKTDGITIPTLTDPSLDDQTYGRVIAGDGRTMPQSACWISVGVESVQEFLGLAIGASRSVVKLKVLCGVRSQEYATTAVPDFAWSTEDHGWRSAHLLARVAEVVLVRYLSTGSEGVYQVLLTGLSMIPTRSLEPDVFMIALTLDVYLQTYNAALTS